MAEEQVSADITGGEEGEIDTLAADAQKVLDEKKLVSEVKKRNDQYRQQRKKHESRWFLNGAFLRGQQHVEYNEGLAQLVSPNVPSYRVRLDINRIRPKTRARMAKFFKSRPRPTVVPASTEYRDVLSARATEQVLIYHWDRLHLEEKYKDARYWASIASKGYWWFSIDETATARIRTKDAFGNFTEQEAVLGDINIEVSSPFEVLVADPAISRIGDQPIIQRMREMKKEDVKQRYDGLLGDEKVEGSNKENVSQYVDKLATLRAGGGGGAAEVKRDDRVVVIEEFTAPCASYPKGRYLVVVGDRLAQNRDELPYGMYDHKVNPYPVIEFTDSLSPGQYWSTTFVEQLIDLQRQYNYLFELMVENIRACSRPKVVFFKQHNLPDGAYTTAAGEILELNYIPGVPQPYLLQPANVAGDVWNLINTYDRLFNEITQIYPASEGAVASATSGFQTNLLQEATDTVHAPDVREDELTLQEAAWKIRRLCKLWYDVPRLVAIGGVNSVPSSIEFSKKQINEYAEVRIQAGSMLPDLKAARAQTALELYKQGLFGDQADPMVRKRVLNVLDMGGLDAVREEERKDTDEAEVENQKISDDGQVAPAQFFQIHPIHLDRHTSLMKSPAYLELTPQAQQMLKAHIIGHLDWTNAPLAQSLRLQYGLQQLPLATPPPPPMPPQQLGPPGPQAPGIPPGQAPPQGGPPQAPAGAGPQ